MKFRFLYFIMLVAMCISLGGCGKDALALQMVEEINSIGEVTPEDEKLIIELEQTYSDMTDKQKNQVDNYVDLKNARRELDALKQAEAEEQRKAAEEVTELTDEELAACYAVQMVKCGFQRNNTMIINYLSVAPYSEDINYAIKVQFTVDTDSLGKSENFTAYVCVDLDSEHKIETGYRAQVKLYGIVSASAYAEEYYNDRKANSVDVDKIVENMDKFIEIEEGDILDPAKWDN